MKIVILLSLAIISIQSTSALANSAVFNATAVDGFSNYSKQTPTKCTFASVNVNSGGQEVVRVYLNADTTANINYAIDIPANDIPLENGYQSNPYTNITISYNNGILHAVDSRDAEMGPRAKIVETIDIPVTPDLQRPTGVATANSVFKDLFHSIGKVDQQLHCQFGK